MRCEPRYQGHFDLMKSNQKSHSYDLFMKMRWADNLGSTRSTFEMGVTRGQMIIITLKFHRHCSQSSVKIQIIC